MGLFICDLCNEELCISHSCKPENIRKNFEYLEAKARQAENRLEEMRNAVFRLIEPLQTLDKEEITVKTEWLRKLWDTTQCQWYEAKTPEQFLVRWMAMHNVLRKAFDLFQSKRSGTDKLKILREACESAKEILGYQDSKFDL